MRIVLAGATGEVGSSLREALGASGHLVVPVTSRPLDQVPVGFASLDQALDLIASGDVDVVVNAAGPGDRRDVVRDVHTASTRLASVAGTCDVPAVLISTLRVCEGVCGPVGDDTVAEPLTPYGQMNAEHEAVWLSHRTAMVLRMANYFCTPQTFDSPQSMLLPWSLLLEGWATGTIGVRSSANAAKTFVNDVDVAAAVVLLAQTRPYGRCVATLPGIDVTLEQLVAASIAALAAVDRPCTVSFGSEPGADLHVADHGWLREHGWASTLSAAAMQQRMHAWLVEWGTGLPSGDEGR